jgi:short-chain fatty acids transporter
LTVVVGWLGLLYLGSEVHANGASVLLQLNRYIFLFLMVGLLLHWRPKSFMRAVSDRFPLSAASTCSTRCMPSFAS